VLLLDEPLSNLDPALRQSTRDELRSMLRRVGAPALFVTHDQEDAFAVADRIVLLSKGRVLQIGTPQELYARPRSRGVASFIGRATLVSAQDRGSVAVVTIGGNAREIPITKPANAVPGSGAVVLRPESLRVANPEISDGWPGVISGRRFAGASNVYHVTFDDGVVVEVSSTDEWKEGERVAVVVYGAVPFVPE
jgi:iron(III) transport system ATP-binding protein